ncbi:MAG: GatB/YqeY domain-containing protein [Polyangiales bacterium]
MDLKTQIMNGLKEAMRARDDVAKETLRLLKSAITLQEVDKGAALDDGEVQQLLKKALKTRDESAEQYAAGGRPELAERERAEAEVIRRYLPTQLDEAATRAAVTVVVAELSLSGKKDMGRLMQALRQRHPGQIDGKLAAKVAGETLAG